MRRFSKSRAAKGDHKLASGSLSHPIKESISLGIWGNCCSSLLSTHMTIHEWLFMAFIYSELIIGVPDGIYWLLPSSLGKHQNDQHSAVQVEIIWRDREYYYCTGCPKFWTGKKKVVKACLHSRKTVQIFLQFHDFLTHFLPLVTTSIL